MMDADVMYPEGFHPINLNHTADWSGFAKHTSRAVAKVKYYFIDFGISVHVPEDLHPKLVTGFLGRDRDPPELLRAVPYDPFKLDIFIIGNMLKREFQEVRSVFWSKPHSQLTTYKPFSNVNFLKPLVDEMTQADPSLRPDAKVALARWRGIRKSISVIHKEWRPRPQEERPLGTFIFDAVSLHHFFMFCAKSFAKRVRL